jgi:serine/threonine protein kinase
VLEVLGGGRRYEVFLVHDEQLGGEAVAKVLRPDRAADEGAQRALRREADILGRLSHPVLVRCFDAVPDGPYPHLLVEYVDGDNLREILGVEVTLSVAEGVSLALELLSALQHMAHNGVLHLDVKPSNIVIGDPPRLIDMGAARTLQEIAARRTPIGTAAYMAPEQCEPASELGPIGPPADVWGVGATLYHALTGNRPFSRPGPRGSEPAVRYPQLVERPPPIPDYVPAPVGGIVLAMLAHEPRERPSAAEAAAALEALAGEPAET